MTESHALTFHNFVWFSGYHHSNSSLSGSSVKEMPEVENRGSRSSSSSSSNEDEVPYIDEGGQDGGDDGGENDD